MWPWNLINKMESAYSCLQLYFIQASISLMSCFSNQFPPPSVKQPRRLSMLCSFQYRIRCQQVGKIDSATSIPEELVKYPQPGQRRRFSCSQSLRKPQYKNRSTEQRALSIGASPLPLWPEAGQTTNKTRNIERKTSLANINNQFFSLISISSQVM